MTQPDYVHGYSPREAERLHDQADAVRDLLHHDSRFEPGSRVLEAGCGVGAQTITLARHNPECQFTSIDISGDSLCQAARLVRAQALANVRFQQTDIYALPYPDGAYDHVFICYVLEHLTAPERALAELLRVTRPGGGLTVIEGDHGSCYFHPETQQARKAWQCLIDVQASLHGDSLIGRRLYPLLRDAGLSDVVVSPRMVYADHSRPRVVEGFVGNTIIPMVEGVRQAALECGMIDAQTWDKGIADLRHILSTQQGTFCYTFFKATGRKG